MFKIRAANADDKESIRRIYLSVVGPPTGRTESEWDQLMQAGGLLVAQREGRTIGFGGFDVTAAEQLKWLYLLSEYRGAGVGSEMLQRLEDIGWEAGLNSVRLHSAPDSVEFYRRHGYKLVGAAEQLEHDHEGVEMVKDRQHALPPV